MNKFGVCNYNFDTYEPKIENLKYFENYEDAFDYYMDILTHYQSYPYAFDRTLWIVWINENNRIIQFEQLSNKTKCKLVEIN